jgi:hypothetical protein
MAQLLQVPRQPTAGALKRAFQILEAAHLSVESFAQAFSDLRSKKKARGTTTDEEQDILRAMLLFAGAGLDSMIKQAARDALRKTIQQDVGAYQQFKDHVKSRLGRTDARSDSPIDLKILASALASTTPQQFMIEDLVESITSRSLQSTDQVLAAAAHFGVTMGELKLDLEKTKAVFLARNQIAHELDVDFSGTNRSRRSRTRDNMVDAARHLLGVAANFITAVDAKLTQKDGSTRGTFDPGADRPGLHAPGSRGSAGGRREAGPTRRRAKRGA